ncbi:MAG: DUF4349 domain-containing protein [Bacteroidales bacterium]|nr:DUF4349 domain-containing protein [Bacteroidales bacterium]
MKTQIIILLSLFLWTACSNESKNTENEEQFSPEAISMTESANYNEPENQTSALNSDLNKNIGRKIIKTADLEMEVNDLKQSRIALNNLLKKFNAYVSDEKVSEWDNRLNDEITIRVDAESFDSLLNHVSSLAAHIVSKHVKQSDVTEEYIDIKTRLENKKKVEQQYLELLKKAKNINEILQVTEHLRTIREEIEAKEGRLKYLNSQISLSTIYLTMYQYTENNNYPGFGSKLLKAFKGGWEGIQLFVLGLIYLWPFIIIILVAVWLIIRYRKRKK